MPNAIEPIAAQINITKFNKSAIAPISADCVAGLDVHIPPLEAFPCDPAIVTVIVAEYALH
jgi:hypothetical protein